MGTALQNSLDRMKLLRPGWDGNSADVPNATAIGLVQKVYTVGEKIGLFPVGIGASVEAGIVLTYAATKSLYIVVECLNEGSIVAGISSKSWSDEPDVWEVDINSKSKIGLLGSLHKIKAVRSQVIG